MANHNYEIGLAKTTTAAAGPICTVVPAALAVGVQPPAIVELGIFNVSGVAAEIGLGYPAANGSGAITGGTVQALSPWQNTGDTQVATSFATTQPTAPTNYMRRAELQGLVGAGIIWTWDEDEFMLWAGATIPQVVLWQISVLAVTYDVYLKVRE